MAMVRARRRRRIAVTLGPLFCIRLFPTCTSKLVYSYFDHSHALKIHKVTIVTFHPLNPTIELFLARVARPFTLH
jgi:hypothetical protein